MKICNKCHEEKDFSEFGKHPGCKDGVRSNCKVCRSKSDAIYRNRTKDTRSKKGKEIRKQKSKIRRENKEKKLIDKYINIEFGSYKVTKYLGRHKYGNAEHERYYFEKECKFCGAISKNTPAAIEKWIIIQPICNLCNESVNIHTKERKCACCQVWMPANSDYFPRSKNRRFGIYYYCLECKNKKSIERRLDPEIRKREYLHTKEKLKVDHFFRFKRNIRNNIKNGLKACDWKKTSKTHELLGETYEVVRDHLQNKFENDMNWDNHGKWHIDHIVPLSSAKTEEEAIKLCHYTNLQPLWAFDNISKGAKLDWKRKYNI